MLLYLRPFAGPQALPRTFSSSSCAVLFAAGDSEARFCLTVLLHAAEARLGCCSKSAGQERLHWFDGTGKRRVPLFVHQDSRVFRACDGPIEQTVLATDLTSSTHSTIGVELRGRGSVTQRCITLLQKGPMRME